MGRLWLRSVSVGGCALYLFLFLPSFQVLSLAFVLDIRHFTRELSVGESLPLAPCRLHFGLLPVFLLGFVLTLWKTHFIMSDPKSSSDILSGSENAGGPFGESAGSEPVFFDIPGKGVSESFSESSPGSSSEIGDILELAEMPSLEDVSSELPVNLEAREVDPEFDSLPGLESQGSKFGFWAIVLGVVGVVFGLIAFGGGLNLRVALGLGLVGLLLGVVSFFKQPKIWKSVVGVVLCFLVVVGAGTGLFFLSLDKAGKRLEQDIRDMTFDLARAGSAGLSAEGSRGSEDSDVGSSGEGSEAEEDVFDLTEEEALVVIPPELRPIPKGEVGSVSASVDSGDLLSSDERGSEVVIRSDDQLIGALWLEAEKGILAGAGASERNFARRVANFTGYPLDIYSGFSSDLRLYVLRQAVLRSGVDLSNLRERGLGTVSPSLYSPGGFGGVGVGGSEVGGPGPLPSSKVSFSDLPMERVRRIFEFRSYGTPSDGVGKFMFGVTLVQLRGLLDEALSIGLVRNDPLGKQISEAKFGRQVGWDSMGLASTRIRIVFDKDGALEDAYPY